MKHLFRAIDGMILAVTACLTGIIALRPALWVLMPAMLSLFLLINIFPSHCSVEKRKDSTRLQMCSLSLG